MVCSRGGLQHGRDQEGVRQLHLRAGGGRGAGDQGLPDCRHAGQSAVRLRQRKLLPNDLSMPRPTMFGAKLDISQIKALLFSDFMLLRNLWHRACA